jgi:hypothetical protein
MCVGLGYYITEESFYIRFVINYYARVKYWSKTKYLIKYLGN